MPGECFREARQARLLAISRQRDGLKAPAPGSGPAAVLSTPASSPGPGPMPGPGQKARGPRIEQKTALLSSALCGPRGPRAAAAAGGLAASAEGYVRADSSAGRTFGRRGPGRDAGICSRCSLGRHGWQSCRSGRCKQRDSSPRGAGEDSS